MDARVYGAYMDRSLNVNNGLNHGRFEGMIVSPSGMSTLISNDEELQKQWLEKTNETVVRSDDYRGMGSVFMQYTPVKGLDLSWKGSIDLSQANRNSFKPSFFECKNVRKMFSEGQVSRKIYLSSEVLLRYKTSIKEKHNLEILLGMDVNKDQVFFIKGEGRGQASDYIYYYNAAFNLPIVNDGTESSPDWRSLTSYNSDFREKAMVSYFGRFGYNYKQRYLFEGTLRRDGSSTFGEDHKWATFPSVAVGWAFSEEKFMEPYKDTFSKIKFRGSFGLTGNDQLDGRRFAYQTTLGEDGTGYDWGTNGQYYHRNSRFEGDFGIPNLTWETVSKTNAGFELGLWNMIDFQVDYFFEHRYNIFMKRNNIPTSAGFRNTPWANYGKVNNQGIDLALNVNKQINKDLYVGFRGSFTYAQNKIIEQDEALGVMGTNRQRTGEKVNQLFGLVDEGLFTFDDFQKDANGDYLIAENGGYVVNEDIPTHTFGPVRPGDIKYKDVNGDGVVSSLDETAIGGTYNPQIVYGFGANFRYKNLDFNIFFQGNGMTYGFKGGCSNKFTPGETMGAMGNILTNYQDRWTVENPSQDVYYPRLTWGKSENNVRNSTWWLENMSFLRVKDIEIGYTLPKSWVRQIGLSNIRLYAKGSNLFTFSKFDLWDPEVDTSVGTKYPIMKSFSAGFDINF